MTGAPTHLSDIAADVDARLEEIISTEQREWFEVEASFEDPLNDLSALVLGGGKRIRPAYCHWGWVIAGGDADSQAVLDAGCALELLHAFALAHDDVMDGSPTRRGAPSVWRRFIDRHHDRDWQGEDRRFGEAAAVLVGDMAMALADRVLGPIDDQSRDIWNRLRTELNMGQFLDMVGTARGAVSAQQARLVIEYKTALYTVVRPLQLGAALAGRPDLADSLDSHGRPIGLAFQLRDDMLGAFGDPEATGKPVGDDLREGKPTLLMALGRAAATSAQLEVLDAAGSDIDDHAVTAIQQVLVDTSAKSSVEQEIDKLLDEGLEALEALPQVPAAQQALADLARFVAHRQA